ncbi:MSHA biogenesis protein MshA [Vibrio panuliri]|uniref:MSHA biogenesis protein MshA n=1 Tax=Vibrio panuliri TaxID=1381081 RepID=A0A1Q9HC76_9VIBR|nr:prepilin-type N-terminal cleavage/methylation domain-containing protein [Vibrio panuliri]OLQ86965.1 MSHA biogenesis protein MshA [Vibrio panuliri]
MKRQGGFTLIELVVVIVILGILAVTAAPRFLNLQDDAREATLQGLSGAIQGASSMIYGKAAINGIEASNGPVSTGTGTDINTVFGYPEATETAITEIVQGIGDDFVFIKDVTGDPKGVTFGIEGYESHCVQYTEADDKTTPAKVEVVANTNDVCKKSK